MKRLLFSAVFFLFSLSVFSQVTFDLGIKAGVNNSKLSLNKNDYSTESITKMHIGAFGRVGFGRLYAQPEVYFSKKGGEIHPNPIVMATSFDYNNVDVPMLVGFKIIKGKVFELHALAGPVFSFITNSDVNGDAYFDPDYYKDSYVGIQYGIGADVLFFTLGARMEHGNKLYDHPDLEGKNSTFMITLGFKIL